MIDRFIKHGSAFASRWGLLLGLICSVAAVGTVRASAEEMRFLVQLIWATNGDKPEAKEGKPELKEVAPELTKKLGGVFKWKNYFEVRRAQVLVGDRKTAKTQISKKCDIEVANLGDSMIEVRLIGEGKKVFKHKQKLVQKEPVVLGGDAQNGTAWFVVLTPQSE